MELKLFCIALVIAVIMRKTSANPDEINNLPGVEFEINFKHYSGYLQGSETHRLHYWFVESQNNPRKDPLLFWFNGGPGCSSLDGLINEMGPYLINPDGRTLRRNPHSWNNFANIVYIESPAGVGFSYSTDGNTTTDDNQTSQESYNAIKDFFDKYPQFRQNSVFITGESYGGVYVPTLTARIIEGQKEFRINLKGVAIGNGYVNADLNIDTSIRFAYGHGIIDELAYNKLELECCRGCIDGCDLTTLSGNCGNQVADIFNFMWTGGLNPYDLYRDCDPNPEDLRLRAITRGVVPVYEKMRLMKTPQDDQFSYIPKKLRKLYKTKTSFGSGSVPCLNDTDVTDYMNNPEVKRALHVSEDFSKWTICSDDISTNYKKIYGDMAPFINKILLANVRVMLYYGDTDMACNFLLGQQFSARLGLKRVLNKTPWKFNKQIAGFKTLYHKGLTFITVRGAGHMAPQWKAPETAYIIQQFLLNHPI